MMKYGLNVRKCDILLGKMLSSRVSKVLNVGILVFIRRINVILRSVERNRKVKSVRLSVFLAQ